MEQDSCRAIFMRGGTSKGLFFLAGDLPSDRAVRDAFILRAIGSPDPNGRQLDGMGGGASSLSKAMIVSRSSRPGIDVDYDFAQVSVERELIDWRGNCGNLSSAVGVFALESGLVARPDGDAVVRMFNVNTMKAVDCTFEVSGGHARVIGDCEIAGVSGSGAPIRLDFLDPGGSATGSLLPTGEAIDILALPDGTSVATSIVDASNLCVFVRAADMGVPGTSLPSELRSKIDLMRRLETIRAEAAVRAGVAATAREATRNVQSIPKIALVSPPADSLTLTGDALSAADCDIQVRMLSMGLPHLAIPLTGAMCVGVAAQVPGTLVHECARRVAPGAPFRVGQASGALPVAAVVGKRAEGWFAESVTVTRTARVLMTGEVWVPAIDATAAE